MAVSTIRIFWDDVPGINTWDVEYRPAGSAGAFTFVGTTANNWMDISLSDCSEYEIQITANCPGFFPASKSTNITTNLPTCGLDLFTLRVDNIDYAAQITQVQNGPLSVTRLIGVIGGKYEVIELSASAWGSNQFILTVLNNYDTSEDYYVDIYVNGMYHDTTSSTPVTIPSTGTNTITCNVNPPNPQTSDVIQLLLYKV